MRVGSLVQWIGMGCHYGHMGIVTHMGAKLFTVHWNDGWRSKYRIGLMKEVKVICR